MHHPEQYRFAAKSIQKERWQAAAAERAAKKAHGPQAGKHPGSSLSLIGRGGQRVVGQIVHSLKWLGREIAQALRIRRPLPR